MRVRLLQSVLRDLNSAAGGRVEAFSAYDAAATALANNYRQQAELLGATPEEGSGSDRASQWLRTLIQQRAGQMAKEDAASKLRAEVTGPSTYGHRIPGHRRFAAHGPAGTGMDCASILGHRPAASRSHGAGAGRRRGIAAADRQSANVVAQLRDGQAALLKLWLLWNQPA